MNRPPCDDDPLPAALRARGHMRPAHHHRPRGVLAQKPAAPSPSPNPAATAAAAPWAAPVLPCADTRHPHPHPPRTRAHAAREYDHLGWLRTARDGGEEMTRGTRGEGGGDSGDDDDDDEDDGDDAWDVSFPAPDREEEREERRFWSDLRKMVMGAHVCCAGDGDGMDGGEEGEEEVQDDDRVEGDEESEGSDADTAGGSAREEKDRLERREGKRPRSESTARRDAESHAHHVSGPRGTGTGEEWDTEDSDVEAVHAGLLRVLSGTVAASVHGETKQARRARRVEKLRRNLNTYVCALHVVLGDDMARFSGDGGDSAAGCVGATAHAGASGGGEFGHGRGAGLRVRRRPRSLSEHLHSFDRAEDEEGEEEGLEGEDTAAKARGEGLPMARPEDVNKVAAACAILRRRYDELGRDRFARLINSIVAEDCGDVVDPCARACLPRDDPCAALFRHRRVGRSTDRCDDEDDSMSEAQEGVEPSVGSDVGSENLSVSSFDAAEDFDYGDHSEEDEVALGLAIPTGGRSSPLQLGQTMMDGDVDARMQRDGVDVQHILWNDMPFSREDYRATRLREHAATAPDSLKDVVKQTDRTAAFYRFARNTRRVKCSIFHFQLRNLVWATSAHDVFMMHNASIVHWDAAAQRSYQVLDLSGNAVAEPEPDMAMAAPSFNSPPNAGAAHGGGAMAAQAAAGLTGNAGGAAAPAGGGNGPAALVAAAPLGNVQISTMIAKGELVIAGGFFGELVAKNLRTHVVEYNRRITYDDNAITNAIDVFDNRAMTSNNDCYVRLFDLPTFTKTHEFRYEKAVNHATRQPGGKMVAIVSDDRPVYVMDGETGEKIAKLHGHEEYSFATGWHPNGNLFATGSQDRTCRVWDVRNMGQSLCVLGAHMGAMRSLRFSSCGRFLALAEPRDYVHLYDLSTGDFRSCQEIDLFGEIAGISFSPDADSLFIGMFDPNYGSLLEYERNTNSSSFFPSFLP